MANGVGAVTVFRLFPKQPSVAHASKSPSLPHRAIDNSRTIPLESLEKRSVTCTDLQQFTTPNLKRAVDV